MVASDTPSGAFAALHPGLQRWIAENWIDRGSAGLSPAQEAAIPGILAGRDCVLEAPTAGGKTEAVLFPTLTRAAAEGGPGVLVLYLAPLRALLNDLERRAVVYAAACQLEAFKWHGEVDQADKLARLRRPPHLLLTTPESVEAILLRKAERATFFRPLRCVVVDEAHSFAGDDRGGQLGALLERLRALAAAPFQRVALTATVGNPGALLDWLRGASPGTGDRIRVPPRRPPERDLRVHFFDRRADTEDTPPAQRSDVRRFLALREELAGRRSIVFVRSRSEAEKVARGFLLAEQSGVAPAVRVRTHHGNVSRFYREEAERLIRLARESGIDAIVSTSTLELGIDIGALDTVVQLDGLASAGAFLQRLGRTGRRAGRPQRFRGLCVEADGLLLLVAAVSLGLRGVSEALHLPQRAFHLLAHQILSLSLERLGITAEAAWAVLHRAHAFSGIAGAEFGALVEHMLADDWLRSDGDVLLVGPETERVFLGAGWRRLFAVFDGAPLYDVVHGSGQVGTLDAAFVEALQPPCHFVLAGRLWRVRSIDAKHRAVRVDPGPAGDAPRWLAYAGLGGPRVPFETAQEAGRLLHGAALPPFVDQAARAELQALREERADLDWRPDVVPLRASEGGEVHLWLYAGDGIARTLARLLDLSGVGRVTARWDRVTVRTEWPGADAATAVRAALDRVVAGDLAEAGALRRLLEEGQPLGPFSPFARCLPPALCRAALVERTLDVEGTLRYLRTAALCP